MTIDLPDHGVQEITIKGSVRTPKCYADLLKVLPRPPRGFDCSDRWFSPVDAEETRFQLTWRPMDCTARYCSECKIRFFGNDEAINTLRTWPWRDPAYVTLCRACYDKAGNTVR